MSHIPQGGSMKTRRYRAALAAAAALFLVAGCASQSTTPEQAAPQAAAQPAAQPSATPPASPPGASPARDPRDGYAKRSVYYEFDGYDVKPEYRPLVEAHAQFLKQ